jgi:hypothetical protein
MIRFGRLKPSGLVLLLATVSLEAQNRRHWRVDGVLRDAARAAGAEDLSHAGKPAHQRPHHVRVRRVASPRHHRRPGHRLYLRSDRRRKSGRHSRHRESGRRRECEGRRRSPIASTARSPPSAATGRAPAIVSTDLLHFPRFSLDGSCVTPHGADGRRQSGCGGPHGAGIFLVAFCMAPPGFASLIRLDHRARPNRQFWLCVDIAFRSDRSFACSVSWFSGSP